LALSRGAYTARALAGFLYTVGLLKPGQINMLDYAYTAYKRSAENGGLEAAWRYEEVLECDSVSIKFLGVWDTVNSVLVPRPDRFFIPTMQTLPYTVNNPSVEVCRHACAIDERRRMFRLSNWGKNQEYKSNKFSPKKTKQDFKEVWFAGVHSDVGGGYPEAESSLAKIPLKWMLDEAKEHGLLIKSQMYNHMVMGKPRRNGKHTYVNPDVSGVTHKSLYGPWWILEFMPKMKKLREFSKRVSLLGLYIPRGEPRFIAEGALIHEAVFQRKGYKPINLPTSYSIEGKA